jgi:hypothetical protein
MDGLEVDIWTHVSRRGINVGPPDILTFRQWFRTRIMCVLIDLI